MIDLHNLTTEAEDKYGLPPGLLYAMALAESGGNPNTKPSGKGAVGLMQFMPATARAMKINPLDPPQAVDGAGRMMRRLIDKHDGDVDLALASYNWGEGNVAKHGIEKAPRETREYKAKVRSAMASDDTQAAPGAKDDGADTSVVRAIAATAFGPKVANAASGSGADPDVESVRSIAGQLRGIGKEASTFGSSFMTGLKHEWPAVGRGLEQPFVSGTPRGDALAREDAAARQKIEQARKDSPVATMLGQGVSQAPLALAGGLPAAARFAAYALPGAMQYGSLPERMVRGAGDALGGTIGEGLGKWIGSIAGPAAGRSNPMVVNGLKLTEDINKIAKMMTRDGEAPQINLAPYQMSGSGPRSSAAVFQSTLDSSFGGGGLGAAREAGTKGAHNLVAAFDLGVSAPGAKITDKVFQQARQHARTMWDNVVPNAAKFDVAAIDDSARATLSNLRNSPIDRDELQLFEEALSRKLIPTGERLVRGINGEEVKALHKWLTGYRADAYKAGQHTAGKAADQVIDSLENVLQAQLGPDVGQAFQQARRQYAALSVLERPNVVMHGDVSVGNLAQALKHSAPSAFAESRWNSGTMKLAKWHDAMGGSVPSSMTQERTMAQRVLTDPFSMGIGGGVTGGAIGSLFGGSPVTGAAIGAGIGTGLPYAMQRTMNNPMMRALYSRQGLPSPIRESTQQLLRSTGLLAGLGAAPEIPYKQ